MSFLSKKVTEITNKFLWRKIKGQSSLFYVWRKSIPGKYRKLSRHFICIVMVFSLFNWANAAELQESVTFNIPRQRADLSLINFAEQADITLLFPLDKMAGKQTNSLSGKYSVMEALNILLKDTGLKTDISESGQLSILIDPSFERKNDMAHYKKNKVASSVLAVLGTVAATPTMAETETQIKETEVIEVRGIRGALGRAMDTKREAGGVVDSISAEDIGKFPDTNLAESLQRISGVSIDRSGGEGQKITVRGFGPQFNTVLVNGRQQASEDAGRDFSFDTIAAEMVRSLDVHKTSTATLQSGGIGSTVNINTAKPFAIGGFKAAGSVKAIYDGNSEETTPQVSGLISNTFNEETFGVLLAVSYLERETRLNRAQSAGWRENSDFVRGTPRTASGELYSGNVFIPQNFDSLVTTEKRERTNANLVVQYAPADNLVVTADALYSDFDVKSDTTSYGHWFSANNVENVIVDENGTVTDMYQEVGLATDFHAKKADRLTESKSFGLNFDWEVNDNLNMQFDISHSNATRDANNGRGGSLALLGYANRVQWTLDDNILPYYSNFADADGSIYSGQQEADGVVQDPNSPDYVPPQGVSDYLDPANSGAHVMIRGGNEVEDDITQVKWDGVWTADGDSGFAAAKFGVMFSSETKTVNEWNNTNSGIHCTYCNYQDFPDVSAFEQEIFDAGDDFLSDVSGSGRTPTRWLSFDGEALFDYLGSIEGIDFDAVKTSNSFEVEEETSSFYLELDFEGEVAGMFISSTAGFRYESTDVEVSASQANVQSLSILDATEMLAAYGPTTDFSEKSSYDEILPNFSVKLEITDDLLARAAVSKTLTRPTLSSLRPITKLDTVRQGNLQSSSGNAKLIPFISDNLDLSLEWYYDQASYLSAGYFRKHVANFITNVKQERTFVTEGGSLLTDPSTGSDVSAPDADDSVAVFTNTAPENGESATVDGWEFAAQHTFGESGFGVIANATIVDSDAELDNADITQVFAVTGLSDSLNLVAFYEKGSFQGRIAYNWRDTFLQSLSQGGGDGVTYVEDYAQWDASASYDLTDGMTVFVEGINLTEEYTHSRGRFANQLLDIVDSGRRISLGVRGTF
ncbi:TonB-dependent receptor [Thalassomonas haliotis]|uniref:TonB-dependent receptor n=2 Tax=Thalassomonas haliotis TaxID=485448 RepID=A0ABY7V9F5_9GAMM|nr:TonB-dependent receptor [Thalassomonas haliotis]